MASIAGLKDFRGEGPPGDTGTFQIPATAIVFQFTHSGTTTIVAMRVGVSGWVLIDQGAVVATVINSALTLVGGADDGEVVVLAGAYTVLATLNVPESVLFRGMGWATIFNYDAGGNCITITGDNVKIRDLKIVITAGAGAGGTRPNCILADTRTNLEIFGVWLIGDETVADDASDLRQNGIVFDTVTFSKVVLCRSDDNMRHGMFITGSDDNVITGNTCNGNTRHGLYFSGADDNAVTGNTCTGNTQDGIRLAVCSDNSLTGNTCMVNTQSGIRLETGSDNSLTGNTCTVNTQNGIRLNTSSDNSLTGNTCSVNVIHGITIDDSSNNTLVGNTCNENDSGDTGNFDGINITDISLDNLVHSNTCNDNDNYGIDIDDVRALRNWVKNNQLRGNTSGPFNDGGTGTKLATVPIQFVQGSVFISQDAFAKGWHIQQANEYAVALGQLPLEVQQVVRIKIWAVALDAPLGGGGQMHLEIIFNAGASNAAFNTAAKSWTLTDFDSEEADYVADDIVHWVIEDGDVGNELSNLVAADSAELKVIYEAGAAPDGETDAVFRVVEIEYV